MSTESPDRQQQKVREFMSLLPLTLAIAGLPDCEPGKHFNDGQMDARHHPERRLQNRPPNRHRRREIGLVIRGIRRTSSRGLNSFPPHCQAAG